MMGSVASRSIALVAKAGCVFGAVTLTPFATTKGVSGSSGADDGDGVALAPALASDGAAEAPVADEAACGSAVVVPGDAAEHPTTNPKETATATAAAVRLVPAINVAAGGFLRAGPKTAP